MPLFHCTKKLLAHLGVAPAGAEVVEAAVSGVQPRLGNWYANLVQLEKRKAVLFTNERTLFSFVMLKVRAKSPSHLPVAFMQGLSNALTLEGYNRAEVAKVLSEYEGLTAFTTATNQKVLGSMNAVMRDLEHIIWHNYGLGHTDLGQVIHRLNNTPWGATDYKYASELIGEILIGGRAQ